MFMIDYYNCSIVVYIWRRSVHHTDDIAKLECQKFRSRDVCVSRLFQQVRNHL